MPKPKLHKHGPIKVGPDALMERPKIASAMMYLISAWSGLEQNIAGMFAMLLDGELSDAFNIFHSFHDIQIRKRIFDEVASELLSQTLKEEIELHFKELRKVGWLRHEIAHGQWGVSDLYPDCVLLVDWKEITKNLVTGYRIIIFEGASKIEPDHVFKNLAVQRYYLEDFKAYGLELVRLSNATHSLAARIAREVLVSKGRRLPEA